MNVAPAFEGDAGATGAAAGLGIAEDQPARSGRAC